jgi:hypothetical protein
MATSEERVAHWKILGNQWSNEHAFRDSPNHHLVFTKTDEEPASFTPVGNSAASPEPLLRPSPATGHSANMLEV